jgi:hypothetical protein
VIDLVRVSRGVIEEYLELERALAIRGLFTRALAILSPLLWLAAVGRLPLSLHRPTVVVYTVAAAAMIVASVRVAVCRRAYNRVVSAHGPPP